MDQDLKTIIAVAIKTSDLDCSTWDEDIRRELAHHIITEVQKAGYQFYEYDPR